MPMTFEFFGALGIAKILALSVAMTRAEMPVSWSPDSRWICYTVAEPREATTVPPNWLFESGRRPNSSDGDVTRSSPELPRRETGRFRIWATQSVPPLASALLEESEAPLGSPSWRPDGRAVAFCHFVPREREGGRLRGRFEVIVKEGLDRRRVLYVQDHLELAEGELADFLETSPAWNRDGTNLAVTRPAGDPAVLILDARTGSLTQTIENASRPVWSPNGSRLAAVRADSRKPGQNSLVLVESPTSTTMARVRILMPVAEILQAPIWSSDGQSLHAVYWKARPAGNGRNRLPEFTLGRVSALTGERYREWSLSPDPMQSRNISPQLLQRKAESRPSADARVEDLRRGVSRQVCRFDFQPETEECFYTTEIAGQASTIVCQNLRGDFPQVITHKRFAPLDVTIGIGTLAASPDGRTLAIRFRSAADSCRLSTPAFCDIATDALTIPPVDDAARLDWLSRLSGTIGSMLSMAIPAPTVPGVGLAERPVLLPAPGELTPGHPLASRVNRLAKIGRSLCEGSSDSLGHEENPGVRTLMTQGCLYFNYLAGDMKGAEAALNELEGASLTSRQYTALLGVRAQILMTKGDLVGATAIIDYLIEQEPATIRAIEETPVGLKMDEIPNPRKIWGNYLSLRRDDVKKQREQQERVHQPHESLGLTSPRPEDLIEEIDRPAPLRIPFIPDARLFVEPPDLRRP